jgi:hypothetical protein
MMTPDATTLDDPSTLEPIGGGARSCIQALLADPRVEALETTAAAVR